jgi:hypothetical protein
VKEEQGGVIQGLVQVTIQAASVLAARGDHRQQFLPDLTFLAWL